MDDKSLQITNHDFFIYRDSNNDVKVAKKYGKRENICESCTRISL